MYFRADKRHFEVGDEIRSAGDFSKLNPVGSESVESLFEAVRPPDKPSRIGSLFLFKDERSAKRHWSKMTDGNLYLATLATASSSYLTHEGDMCLIDEAFLCQSEPDAVKNIAEKYWSGFLTQQPIIETLVPFAIIHSILSKDQQERLAFLKNWGTLGIQAQPTFRSGFI